MQNGFLQGIRYNDDKGGHGDQMQKLMAITSISGLTDLTMPTR